MPPYDADDDAAASRAAVARAATAVARRRRRPVRHAGVQPLDPRPAQERAGLALAPAGRKPAARQAGRRGRGQHGPVRRRLGAGRAAQGALRDRRQGRRPRAARPGRGRRVHRGGTARRSPILELVPVDLLALSWQRPRQVYRGSARPPGLTRSRKFRGRPALRLACTKSIAIANTLAVGFLALYALGRPGVAPLWTPTTSPLGQGPRRSAGVDRRALLARTARRCTSPSATGLQIYDVPRRPRRAALPAAAAALRERGRRRRPRHRGHHERPVVQRRRRDLPDRRRRTRRRRGCRSTLPTNVPVAGADNTTTATSRTASRAATTSTRRARPRGSRSTTSATSTRPKYVKTIPLPGKGFTHDVAGRPPGIAWVTGEDGTFGYDTTNPPAPKCCYRSDPSIVNSGGGPAGRRRLRPARLPPPQHAAHVDQPLRHRARSRAKTAGLGQRARDHRGGLRQPTCEGQGSLQTWRITDERNADGSIKLELLDLWTTELNELANATGRSPATVNCSAHWFEETAASSPRAGTTRACASSTSPTRATSRQVGYYVTQGDVLGRVLRADRPERETVYALDTTSGLDVPAHPAARHRDEAAQEADEPVRARGARLRARRATAGATPAGCPPRCCNDRAPLGSQRDRASFRRPRRDDPPSPPLAARLRGVRSSPVREILALTERPGVISFAGGLPAPELFDAAGLRAAFAAALADERRRPLAPVLDDRGRPGAARRGRRAADRARAADERRRAADHERLAAGADADRDRAARAGRHACSSRSRPTSPRCRPSGSPAPSVVPVPCDDDGLDPEAAAALAARHGARLLYTIPTFQNPTGRTLPLERREALVALAARAGFWLLEDDPYGELRYRGEPLPPLAALPRRRRPRARRSRRCRRSPRPAADRLGARARAAAPRR